MSGCGDTWFSKRYNAIGFEPVTDKDFDRLEALLEDLRKAGHKRRISKKTFRSQSFWLVALGDMESK